MLLGSALLQFFSNPYLCPLLIFLPNMVSLFHFFSLVCLFAENFKKRRENELVIDKIIINWLKSFFLKNICICFNLIFFCFAQKLKLLIINVFFVYFLLFLITQYWNVTFKLRIAVGVNSSGVCGALFVADPLDACSPLRNALPSNKSDLVRFALIIRGKCAFEEKALKAQNAGFKAAIVYDDRYNGDLVYSES